MSYYSILKCVLAKPLSMQFTAAMSPCERLCVWVSALMCVCVRVDACLCACVMCVCVRVCASACVWMHVCVFLKDVKSRISFAILSRRETAFLKIKLSFLFFSLKHLQENPFNFRFNSKHFFSSQGFLIKILNGPIAG